MLRAGAKRFDRRQAGKEFSRCCFFSDEFIGGFGGLIARIFRCFVLQLYRFRESLGKGECQSSAFMADDCLFTSADIRSERSAHS
jgi:hypothetical protein